MNFIKSLYKLYPPSDNANSLFIINYYILKTSFKNE